MKLHGNAALSLKKRQLLVSRVIDERWSLMEANITCSRMDAAFIWKAQPKAWWTCSRTQTRRYSALARPR